MLLFLLLAPFIGAAQAVDDDERRPACYDSTLSFDCHQPRAAIKALDCRIIDTDGTACFPDLAKLLVSKPLAYLENGATPNANVTLTAENLQSLTLRAPFEYIPGDAFAAFPNLSQISLEAIGGLKRIDINRYAFRNSSANELKLTGYDLHDIMTQVRSYSNPQPR